MLVKIEINRQCVLNWLLLRKERKKKIFCFLFFEITAPTQHSLFYFENTLKHLQSNRQFVEKEVFIFTNKLSALQLYKTVVVT